MSSTYGELDMKGERRIQWAFKGKRAHMVMTNTPATGHPNTTISIEIPRGAPEHVIVPGSLRVTFDLNLTSAKKGRSIVNNVGRALVATKELQAGSKTLEQINNAYIYDVYQDLFIPEVKSKKYRLLKGIQNEPGRKARVGATKDDGTALTVTKEENAIAKTWSNKFCIPLDFEFFNQPIYPYGLEDKLVVRLTLNSAENVILVAGDAKASYTISDICLEYDVINDKAYGEALYEQHREGTNIPYNRITCVHYDELDKKASVWKLPLCSVNARSCRGVLMLFKDDDHGKDFDCKNETFYNPTIKKLMISINGLNHEIYPGGMLPKDFYPEILKYFDQDSEVTPGEFCTTKFGCWVDMRSSEDNKLHGSGRVVDNGIQFLIDKVAETSGKVKCYTFAIRDGVVHIRDNRVELIE